MLHVFMESVLVDKTKRRIANQVDGLGNTNYAAMNICCMRWRNNAHAEARPLFSNIAMRSLTYLAWAAVFDSHPCSVQNLFQASVLRQGAWPRCICTKSFLTYKQPRQ